MDRNTLRLLAEREGFAVEPLEKVARLGELAGRINRHPRLGVELALKGGTALNMFDGPPPRLSVDLDFNYVGSVDRTEMLTRRPGLEKDVQGIARELGYSLQESSDESSGRKYFLGYRTGEGNRDRIEIDLNFAHRLPLAPLRRAEMWQPGEVIRPQLQLCGREEVASGKICAFFDRRKPRDLYDVIRLPRSCHGFWETPEFRALVIAFTGILDHPLSSYTRERLEQVRDTDIRAELVPMLGRSENIDRNTLLTDAWSAVERFGSLTPPEQDFVDQLQRGELRLDLLDSLDAEGRERLERWPPILWKIRNAAAHHRGSQRPDSN